MQRQISINIRSICFERRSKNTISTFEIFSVFVCGIVYNKIFRHITCINVWLLIAVNFFKYFQSFIRKAFRKLASANNPTKLLVRGSRGGSPRRRRLMYKKEGINATKLRKYLLRHKSIKRFRYDFSDF